MADFPELNRGNYTGVREIDAHEWLVRPNQDSQEHITSFATQTEVTVNSVATNVRLGMILAATEL